MAHSRGISLRGRATGFHRYRDEIEKRTKAQMRRRVRRLGKIDLRRSASDCLSK